jgi:hypothetical protein
MSSFDSYLIMKIRTLFLVKTICYLTQEPLPKSSASHFLRTIPTSIKIESSANIIIQHKHKKLSSVSKENSNSGNVQMKSSEKNINQKSKTKKIKWQ